MKRLSLAAAVVFAVSLAGCGNSSAKLEAKRAKAAMNKMQDELAAGAKTITQLNARLDEALSENARLQQQREAVEAAQQQLHVADTARNNAENAIRQAAEILNRALGREPHEAQHPVTPPEVDVVLEP